MPQLSERLVTAPVSSLLVAGGILNIRAFLERPASRRFALRMLVICGLLAAVEGIDTYIVASILPVLSGVYGVAPAAFALVFIGQGIGQVLGSYGLAPLADRWGRRPIILSCTTVFGLLTVAAALTTSVKVMAALRLISFIGLGAAMPNLFAVAAEYAAPANRHRFLLTIGSIHGLGAGLASLAGAWLLGVSWQAPLMFSAALTLGAAAVGWAYLPESLPFLVARAAREPERIKRAIRQIDSGLALEEVAGFGLEEPASSHSPVRALFASDTVRTTLLLWATSACLLPILGAIGQWLPTFLHLYGGASPRLAAGMTSISALPATVWPFVLMLIMDRVGVARGLALNLLLGSMTLLCFSGISAHPNLSWLIALGFGAFIAGSMSGFYALCARSYPTELRATGMGWAIGAGRVLVMVVPPLGGAALALKASAGAVALAVSLPVLIGAVSAFLIGRHRARFNPS